MQIFNLPFWTFVGVIAGIYTILSLGLFVQYAMAGLPNFGHVAFMALAAYTMAILVIRLSAPMWLAAVAGLLAAVIFSVLLGVPSLRLRADYLAIATVAGGGDRALPGAEPARPDRRRGRLDRHARPGQPGPVQHRVGRDAGALHCAG